MLSDWDDLPDFLRTPAVRPYYNALNRRRGELRAKRCTDALCSALLLTGLLPVLCVIGASVKLCDPSGPVLYRQERVTRNGKVFRICKFRTMRQGADRMGALVTSEGDSRVTPVGRVLRRWKLDELPQLWNVLAGDMTLVGTRPEVPRYVKAYTPRMLATLLLPAGITSAASLRYSDEERMLPGGGAITEEIYTKVILPEKMLDNLAYLKSFSLGGDVRLLARTAARLLPGSSYSSLSETPVSTPQRRKPG